MDLPDVMLENQEPIRSQEHNMTIDGVNYRLTKHGRARYLERVGLTPDNEILRKCVGDPRAVWAPDDSGFRLVTYLPNRRSYEGEREAEEVGG